MNIAALYDALDQLPTDDLRELQYMIGHAESWRDYLSGMATEDANMRALWEKKSNEAYKVWRAIVNYREEKREYTK